MICWNCAEREFDMNDTTPEIERLQYQMMRDLGSTRRIELACEMYMAARQSILLSLSSVSSDVERRKLFVEKMYGVEFSNQLFSEVEI